MYGIDIPNYDWMRYLRIIPGPEIPELLINSIKSSIGSFRSSDLWYSIESYFYKVGNVVELQQFIVSNKQEWLSYSMNFFQRLYWWKVNFSVKVPMKLIQKTRYPHRSKIGLYQHWILQTKRAWAVWWDDFLTSSSILASIFQEIEPFITEKGIIKSSFSFTKWTYSQIIKERLFHQNTKDMDEQDKKMFYSAFPNWTNLFRFRWDIHRNISNSKVSPVIEKNLSLYSSYVNKYELMERKNIFSVIPTRKRLIWSEWIISHWLFIPVSSYGQLQQDPVFIPTKNLYDAGFILP